MKHFPHVRRSAFLFLFLGLLTLGIYPLVVLTHAGKEVNEITKNKPEMKRSMNFVGVFFLGLITLGIVPAVWLYRLAKKVGRLAKDNGIQKPSVSGGCVLALCYFFGWLILTSLIGFHKFFATLNKLESTLNDKASVEAKVEAAKEILDEKARAEVQAEIAKENEALPAPVEMKEEAPKEEVLQEGIEPFEYVTDVTPKEIKEGNGNPDIAAVYHVARKEEIRKWKVRLAHSNQPPKLFDTEEEALAYAKGLAARRHATVRIKSRED